MKSEDRQEILSVIEPYLADPHVQEMKKFIQHGRVTTYRHVINVVKLAYLLNRRFNVNADKEVFLPAALLHDFYLYDWHEKPLSDLHGYRHPHRAAENAKTVFDVNERVTAAIESHMWPFTLTKLPLSKEAWLVCMADKLASMSETLWMR